MVIETLNTDFVEDYANRYDISALSTSFIYSYDWSVNCKYVSKSIHTFSYHFRTSQQVYPLQIEGEMHTSYLVTHISSQKLDIKKHRQIRREDRYCL